MLPDPREVPFLRVSSIVELTRDWPDPWSERAIREAVRAGVLPAVHVGCTRIPTAALWELAGLTPDMTKAGPTSPAAVDHTGPLTTGANTDDGTPIGRRPPLRLAGDG